MSSTPSSPDTFLNAYRIYCSGNEAHPTYHIFSGLVTLSSIISRRVWVSQGYFDLYPNLYVVLVGPPGNRKTTAKNIALKVMQALGNIPVSAECVTKEKLILDIKENERACPRLPQERRVYTPMTCVANELSEFLGAGGVGMVGFLTTIFDLDLYESKTKNKGETAIVGPFLNLLACTTSKWITDYMRSDVISGGFSRRAIFVFETGKTGRIPFPKITPEMEAAWDRLIVHAKRIEQLAGPMIWDPEAMAFYDDWYVNLKMPSDQNVIGYYESKHAQLLKIATLLSLSERSDLVLRREHVEGGLAILDLAEANLSRVFAGVGRNELNGTATQVLEILERVPPIACKIDNAERQAKLMKEASLRGVLFSAVTQAEMDQILQHLIRTDKIGRVIQGPITYIYLKDWK